MKQRNTGIIVLNIDSLRRVASKKDNTSPRQTLKLSAELKSEKIGRAWLFKSASAGLKPEEK